MNKKIFLIGLLACLFRFAGAAETEFEPLISEDKVWEYQFCDVYYDGSYRLDSYFVKFSGLTIRDGKEYHNLYMDLDSCSLASPGKQPVAFLRENDGEVFMLRNAKYPEYDDLFNSSTGGLFVYGDSVYEFKIYDFSMKPEERFNFVSSELYDKFDYTSCHFWGIDISVHLDSVTSGIFEGVERKIQHISLHQDAINPDSYDFFRVIEGIGAVDDGGFLCFPYEYDRRTGWMTSLRLLSVRDSSGNLLYKSRWYDDDAIESVSADETARISVKGDELAVEASGKWTLSIYNVSGLTVAAHTGTDFGSIDVTPLPSGIYIARLQTAIGTKAIKFAR